MRTIQTYSKRAPFYNAFTRTQRDFCHNFRVADNTLRTSFVSIALFLERGDHIEPSVLRSADLLPATL